MIALDDASKIAAAIAVDTLGRDNVISALSQDAIDALGRDALSVTIVIQPGAADNFRGDDLIATLARLHHSLEDAGDERSVIVRYATQAELAEDDDPEP